MGVLRVLMSFLCGILYPVFKNKWRGTRLGSVSASQGSSLAPVMWILVWGWERVRSWIETVPLWGLVLFLPVGIRGDAQVGGII